MLTFMGSFLCTLKEKCYIDVLQMPTYQSVGGAVQNCTKNEIKPKGNVDSVETVIGFYIIKWK
jgi:hypothetical protein